MPIDPSKIITKNGVSSFRIDVSNLPVGEFDVEVELVYTDGNRAKASVRGQRYAVPADIRDIVLRGGTQASQVEIDKTRYIINPPISSEKKFTYTEAKGFKLLPGVVQRQQGFDVRDLFGFNIQKTPDVEIKRRRDASLPPLNKDVHPLADKAHSYFPVNISGWPNIRPQDILDYLEPVATGETRTNGIVWRDFFNRGQLDENGVWLGQGRAEWLAGIIDNGGRVLGVNAAQHNESPSFAARAEGTAGLRRELFEIGPQGVEAVKRYVRHILSYPIEKQESFVVLELANEPAHYLHAERNYYGDTGLSISEIRDLFEDDMANIARAAIAEGLPDHIMIMFPRYRYNASVTELTELDEWNQGILHRWHNEFGDRMCISTHMYPNWIRANDAVGWNQKAVAEFQRLDPAYPQVLTEMNGSYYDNGDAETTAFNGWSWADMAYEGIPQFVFPIANWGPGSFFSTFRKPGRTDDRCKNTDKWFLWHTTLARRPNYKPLDHFIGINTNRSLVDPLHNSEEFMPGVRLIRTVPGSDEGSITGDQLTFFISDVDTPRNITINPDLWCWVQGSNADDTINASVGPGALIHTGRGNNTIHLGAGKVVVGGFNAVNQYIPSTTGTTIIHGFRPGIDIIDRNGLSFTSSYVDADLIYTEASGAVIKVLGIPFDMINVCMTS